MSILPTSGRPTIFSPLGDRALLATAPDDGERIAGWLAACDAAPIAGVDEVVAGFESMAAFFDPGIVEFDRVSTWLGERLAAAGPFESSDSQSHVLPVLYDGEDLDRIAVHTGLSVEEIVSRHSGAEYRVRVVGFAPGFPYLEGLPPELHTPRQATPRTSVPAGSVAIGGPYTGVYPDASPGGWNLLGRTPMRLFDAARTKPSLLSPGERVRFQPINENEFIRTTGDLSKKDSQRSEPANPVARVIRAGVQTTLQDLGRNGARRIGVGPSGAMDTRSLHLANRLVGASEGSAALEATLTGPVLEFLQPATLAAVGAEVDGLAMGKPLRVAGGDRLDLTRLRGGARCYLAVAGGWQADSVLGSCATDVRAKLGGHRGRPLRDGDTLGLAGSLAAEAPGASNWAVAHDLTPRITAKTPTILRVLRGPQAAWFDDDAWSHFLTIGFRISSDSSRVGLRLVGETISPSDHKELASQPVTRGVIQVPPDGAPIVLGADHQTLGGYPVIACVAAVDLPVLGQLSPNDEVRFQEIDLTTAHALFQIQEQRLRVAVEGIRLHA